MWEVFNGDARTWDEIAESLEGHNPHQSYHWGKRRAEMGGEVLRLVSQEKDLIRAACQCFIKRLPLGLGIVLIQGGPLGDTGLWDQSLLSLIKQRFGLKHFYVRCAAIRQREGVDVINLFHNTWRPCLQRLGSRMSMTLTLTGHLEGIASPSANWRHNLKRGMKKITNLERIHNPNVDQLIKIYREMEAYKGIESPIPLSELKATLDNLKDNLIFYEAKNEQGETIAFRACIVTGKSAWDYLAASSVEARKTYASYVLLNSLVRECAAAGIVSYDLGGVDPLEGTGVYNFKKGTGAKPVEYLGEWEWADSKAMLWLGNAVVWLRKILSRFTKG